MAAFQASERARARSLLATLTEARADIRQGVDPTILERERTLQQRLNARERLRVQLLSAKRTEDQVGAVESELNVILAEFQELEGQIRAHSPRYAALTQPVPLTPREIQQQVLDDDTLLLEYALGGERSFLWAVTPTSIASFELPKRAEIEAAARRAYELMTTSNNAAAKAQAELAAARLGEMLLGPVADKLEKKRLLIVSDGALQYVPFGALPAPQSPARARGPKSQTATSDRVLNQDSGRRTADSGLPLIVDHEIINLPSASVLAVLRRELAGRTPAAKTVAVLADPVFDREDERLKHDAATRGRGDAGNRRNGEPETRGQGDTETRR